MAKIKPIKGLLNQQNFMNRGKSNTKQIDFTSGPLLKKILAYAIPIMAMDLLQLCYNMADSVVVGQFAGHTALAAVSSVSSLINLLICLITGLVAGTNIIVGKYYGAKDFDHLKSALHTSVILSLALGILLCILSSVFTEFFLTWLNTPPDVFPEAQIYLHIYFIGIPFNSLYLFLSRFFLATGDSKRPLLYLSISGLLNVALNLLLDAVFGLGVIGVAIGTIVSQALSALLVTIAIMKGKCCVTLKLKEIRFHFDEFLHMLHFGIPSALSNALYAFSNVWIQTAANEYSSVMIAGFGAEASIGHIPYLVGESFVFANITVVSQNTGSRNMSRVKRGMKLCIGLSMAFTLVVGGAVYFFREPLFRLFCDNLPPEQFEEYLYAGSVKLLYLALFYPIMMLLDGMNTSVRSLGYPTLPTVISISVMFISRVVWLQYIYPLWHYPAGLFQLYPVSWVAGIIPLSILLAVVLRKLKTKWHAEKKKRGTLAERAAAASSIEK